MRNVFLLPVLLRLSLARQHDFSVHNDLLAFPQYEIALSESYVSETEAERLLATTKSRHLEDTQDGRQDLQKPLKYDFRDSRTQPGASEDSSDSSSRPPKESFERLILRNKPYLCTIPYVQPPSSKNNSSPIGSAEAAEKAAEHKKQKQRELIRATNHGWELLKGMQGHCMYYSAGWWVYSFCYNKPDGIKQFHPLPPGRPGVPIYPPVEDPGVQSYILGQFDHEIEAGSGSAPPSSEKDEGELVDADGDDGSSDSGERKDALSSDKDSTKGTTNALSKQRKKMNPLTQLATQNSQTYLVRHLSGGTTCDLTGLPRRVSVQFHCNPNAVDHISMIKETASCVYLMVIQTPLLCNDVAFHPPTDEVPNTISCREIVDESQPGAVQAWKNRKNHQAEGLLKGTTQFGQQAADTHAGQGPGFGGGDLSTAEDELDTTAKDDDRLIIGGIVLGAQKYVGGAEERTIKASNILAKVESGGTSDRKGKIVATLAESDGKQTSIMTEREMKNSGLTEKGILREEVEKWVKKIENGPGAKGVPWRINVVRTDNGLELRVVLGGPEDEAVDDSTESDDSHGKQKTKGEKTKGEKTENKKSSRKDGSTGGDAGSQEEYK